MKKLFLFIVLVGFVSCDDIIEVADISKETVTILAPTHGSVIDTTRILFSWEAIKDAENYYLQVATPAFQNASQILVDTLITKTTFSEILQDANYEWRVKAVNSDYATPFTTQIFSVETE